MSVLNKRMYLKITLIVLIGSSAFAQKQECRAFVTQGSKENQTVIRLNFNENEGSEIGSDIDNRLNAYEWNVQARTILGNENNTTDQPLNNLCTSMTQHVPCFLLAWKSANALKNQVQKTPVNVGSSGEVEVKIENRLVEHNILYKVELKMIRYGKALGIQCFELSMNIESVINNEITSDSTQDNHESSEAKHLELVLIGPDRIFCSTALFINAFVVGNCTHATWKLKESPGAAPEILEYQGSRLEIPENTLKTARTYEIICELKNNDTVLISSSLSVGVRKPKYFIRLQNKNQTVGANQPIKIIAHIDVPITEDHEIIWTCTYENSKCGQFSGVSTLYISKGFSNTGLYQFDLTVTNIGFNKKLYAFVQVIPINRSIEFDEIPLWVKPSEILEVTTHMMNIYSGCTLEWESIHDRYQDEIIDQFQPLDVTKTNYDRRSAVFVNRDPFLKELTPHSDDPGNQKITLKVLPEALQSKQDTKFLLRCNTTCSPENIIFADLEIVTNAPPFCNDLKIYPESGTALLTIFRFETTPAKDKPRDLPLTYSFGWYKYTGSSNDIDNTNNKASDDYLANVTYFAKLQSFYMVETLLPYIKDSDGLLGTVMLVCDNKDSCTTVQGPVIEVKSPGSVSEERHSTIKNEISCGLASNNFDKFTTDMLNAFKSYESLQNEMLLDDLQISVNSYLDQKIKNLLDKFNKNSVHEFISALTATEDVFQLSREVLKDVVKLRGKLVNEKMAAPIVTDDEREALDVIKDINDKNLSVITVNDIRKYFEATEYIITTSDDPDLVNKEKGNFITNMDKYLMEVCVLLYKEPERVNFKFKLQTAYIVMEKFVNAYFRNFRYVPNTNNEWNTNIQILLNQSWHMDVQDKQLCIGKAVLKDYLGHKGLLYYAQLFNNDMSGMKMDKQPNTIKRSTTTPNKFKCSAHYDGGWKQCRKSTVGSSSLICMCDKLGFFKMEDLVDEGNLEGAEGSGTNNGEGTSATNNTSNPNQGSGNGSDSGEGNSGGNNTIKPNQGTGSSEGNGSESAEGNSSGNDTTTPNRGSGSSKGNSDGATTSDPNQGPGNESGNGDSNSDGNNTANPNEDSDNGSGNDGDNNTTNTNQGSGSGSESDEGDSSDNNTTNPNQGSSEDTSGGSTTSNPNQGSGNESNGSEDDYGRNNTANPNQGSENGSDNDGGNNITTPNQESEGSNSGESNSYGNSTTKPDQGSGTEPGTGNGNNGINTGEGGNNGSATENPSTNGNNSEESGVENQGSGTEPGTGNGNNGISTSQDGNAGSATENPLKDDNNSESGGGGPDSGNTNGENGNDNSGGNSDGENGSNATDNPINVNPNGTNTNETTGNRDGGVETGSGGNNTTGDGGSTNPNNSGGNDESTPNGNNGSSGDNGSGNNTTSPNDEGQNNGGTNGNNGNGSSGGGDPDETAVEGGNDGDNVTDIETGGNNNISDSNTINNSSSNGNGDGSEDTTDGNNDNGTADGGRNTTNPDNEDDNGSTSGSDNPDNSNENSGSSNGTNSNGSNSDGESETGGNGSNPTNPDNSGRDTNSTNNSGSESSGGDNSNDGESGNSEGNGDDNNSTQNVDVGSENGSGDASEAPGNLNETLSNNNGGNNENAGNPGNGNNSGPNENNPGPTSGNEGTSSTSSTTTTPTTTSAATTTVAPTAAPRPPVTTPRSETTTRSEIRSASFLSVGDQISLAVIALCILGTSGLILFGIISKRVRKVRAQESNEQPTYPMYADLFQKENMRGDF